MAVKAEGLGRGGALFSTRPRQRACQDPSTWQGGDALNIRTKYQNLSGITILIPMDRFFDTFNGVDY